jgi:hypothetical protein
MHSTLNTKSILPLHLVPEQPLHFRGPRFDLELGGLIECGTVSAPAAPTAKAPGMGFRVYRDLFEGEGAEVLLGTGHDDSFSSCSDRGNSMQLSSSVSELSYDTSAGDSPKTRNGPTRCDCIGSRNGNSVFEGSTSILMESRVDSPSVFFIKMFFLAIALSIF